MTARWVKATALTAVVLLLGAGTAFGGGDKAKTSSDSPTAHPAASPATSAGEWSGRHTMEGEVTNIDQTRGVMRLKTADGMTMDLHFPPSALSSVKRGDRVAVELAMKPAAGGAASPATNPSAPATQKEGGSKY